MSRLEQNRNLGLNEQTTYVSRKTGTSGKKLVVERVTIINVGHSQYHVVITNE